MNRFLKMNVSENYVSFDIFDTLIFRVVDCPHQVFYLMEEYAKKHNVFLPANFHDKRIIAERLANQEICNSDIYDIYQRIEGFSTEEEKKGR